VVVVGGGGVVTVVVVDVEGGSGAVVVGVGRVVGVSMTTVGGGRVGTVAMRPRLVVVVAPRVVVVVEETVVVGLVVPPGVVTSLLLPPLDEKAYHVPTPARISATPPMEIATRRSITGARSGSLAQRYGAPRSRIRAGSRLRCPLCVVAAWLLYAMGRSVAPGVKRR
jgi:hypothetical protein